MSTSLGSETPGTTSSRPRAVVAAALAVVLVLGVLACGYLGYRFTHPNDEPFNPVSGAPAEQSAQARSEVTAVAQQFALRMDDVDGTDVDAYIKSVNSMLTTKAKSKNQEVLGALKQTYTAAKIKGTGKILLSGVADLDEDSATVLVAHDASVTTTQGNLQHHYRWTVDLVKVDGKWLVDDFNPVN